MERILKNISISQKSDFKQKSLKWSQQFKDVIYLESNNDNQEIQQKYGEFDAVLAVGSHKKIRLDTNDSFHQLKSFIDEVNDYVFGYFGYDLKNEIEDLVSNNQDHLKFLQGYFFQPKKIFIWKNKELHLLYLPRYKSEIKEDLNQISKTELSEIATTSQHLISARISKKDYFKKVKHVLDHIHRGDIYEVNFCQEFYAENCIIDPLEVYKKLNKISHAPFSCFFRTNNHYLLSASPERFVKKKATKIITQPIKGTARRLQNSQEDKNLAKILSKDLKERAENIMIVDLLRNDLSKISTKGSVKVEELCKVYSFKQVHQLISTVVCEADKHLHPVDIIKNLFPMGSMTGAPKISAMKIIEEEEETKRGLYSGAVGYFSPEGDFDFNVVIRSILYNHTEKYASFSVGSAITAKSDIENEYQECLIKAKAMKHALS